MNVITSDSQVFFIISSIGFVTLWIFIAVLLFYVIRAAKTFSRVMDKIEKNIDTVGDATKEMLEEVKNSLIFRFLSGRKKRKQK